MKNLPKSDITRYDIREHDEEKLWKLEVHRLPAGVKSKKPQSLEGPREWYGSADSDGYNRPHTLALALRFALCICIHDNELVMREHQPQLANAITYSAIHKNLLRAFDPDEGIIRYERKIRLDKHHDDAYHSLVNYVTVTLARLLLRTMKESLWIDNCLSTIAKFAAKLKVVDADLPQAVAKTMAERTDLQVRMAHLARMQGVHQPQGSKDEDSDGPLTKQQTAMKAEPDMSRMRYFVVMDPFHDYVGRLLGIAIADLTWKEEIDQKADMFETSAIIYDTGFGAKTQFCQERDGSIGAATDRNVIRCATAAFEVCQEI